MASGPLVYSYLSSLSSVQASARDSEVRIVVLRCSQHVLVYHDIYGLGNVSPDRNLSDLFRPLQTPDGWRLEEATS
jgi:hypothetical protein